MSRAVLSLGSNLGDRLAYLQLALDGLRSALVAVSAVYETRPWGVQEQPDFLNAVCVVDDDERDHWDWLYRAQELEQAAGRERVTRWGPRTLDVDLVTVDGIHSDDDALLLPHPGAHARATVLIPWFEIEPDGRVPGRGGIGQLLEALPATEHSGVRRRDDLVVR